MTGPVMAREEAEQVASRLLTKALVELLYTVNAIDPNDIIGVNEIDEIEERVAELRQRFDAWQSAQRALERNEGQP